jgi:hypothetical protein
MASLASFVSLMETGKGATMKLLQLWNRYWFRTGSLFNLAVVRILAVAYSLYILLKPGHLEGILFHTTLPDFSYSPLAAVELLLPFHPTGRPDAALLLAVFWVTVITGFLALIGLFTNPSLFIFGLGNIFLKAFTYSFGDFHHPEAIMLMSLLILSFSPSDQVLSLDETFSRGQKSQANLRLILDKWVHARSIYATWPILVIQWLFAMIYFSSAISKITKGGLDWLNGYTLQYYLVRDGIRWGSELGVFFAQFHWFAVILSWATVIFEAAFFLVLINPRLARIFIPLGIAFHMGIFLTMRAPFFTFMILYSVFVPWSALLQVLISRKVIVGPLPEV